MELKDHTTPEKLEYYAFLWSELLLVLSAIALLLGGVPLIYKVFGYSSAFYGLANSLLILSWIVSGIAAVYLLYLWNKNGRAVFGSTDQKDMAAFLVSMIVGVNVGLTGLLGDNILMGIASGSALYTIVGIALAGLAYYLWKRWTDNGQVVFSKTSATPEETSGRENQSAGSTHPESIEN